MKKKKKSYAGYFSAISVIVVISTIVYFQLKWNKEFIFTDENKHVFVYQSLAERCMTFSKDKGQSVKQGCVFEESPDKLVLNYQKMMLGGFLINPKPKSILMIGLGTGTLARAINLIEPDIKFDIVEINKDMPGIAEQYFKFKVNDKVRIFIEDGYHYLERTSVSSNSSKYDLIIVDAFSQENNYLPASFMTKKFITMLADSISDDGVVVSNIFHNNMYYASEKKLYLDGFKDSLIIEEPGKNRIIFSSKKDLPSSETLEETKKSWSEKFKALGVTWNYNFVKLKL